MLVYIAKRLLTMIPILLVVAILIFTLMYFVPGDPVQIALGDHATEAQIEEVRARLGLDDPFMVRLFNYLKGVFLHLDFGTSYIYGTDVGSELISRLPATLILAIMCVAFSVVFGVPIGIYSAIKANKPADRISMVFTLLLNSMPNFWLALMMVILFALKLHWLPSSGIGGWKYFVLPVLANSLGSLAGIARQTRSSMLEVIRADYVVTARSKGLSESKVIMGHALPNALIPIITVCGSRFGHMLGGTTVIETIFSIPGIGSYMINGINSRDYNVVQGCIVYIAFMFSIMMLITDLIYAFVDPRIKAQYVKNNRKKSKKPAEAGA